MTNRYAEKSVRLSVLEAIEAAYKAVTAEDPPPAGKVHYGLNLSSVELGPLGDFDARKRIVVGIVAGTERKSDLFPLRSVLMDVAIEFRVVRNQGDPKPAVLGEHVLGVIQQVICDNATLGGLVIRFEETGSEVDLLTYGDRTIEGVVRCTVHYRHDSKSVYPG